jgi:hypothetical protein
MEDAMKRLLWLCRRPRRGRRMLVFTADRPRRIYRVIDFFGDRVPAPRPSYSG